MCFQEVTSVPGALSGINDFIESGFFPRDSFKHFQTLSQACYDFPSAELRGSSFPL